MRDQIRDRINEYPNQDLLLVALIMGIAKVTMMRLYLGHADLSVEGKHFDLPVDLAGFPVLADFPENLSVALHAALHRKLAGE
jgi:hypothetical protein